MPVREILLLGNPKLYEVCDPIREDELPSLDPVVQDLHDTMIDFRDRYGLGRAIAAPKIGMMKRLVYTFIDRPTIFINPTIDQKSEEMFEMWDDCMSFPELVVRVKRHKRCRITFRNENWAEQRIDLDEDLGELLQHEVDHLDGILAVQRAIDERSFGLRSQLVLLK
jgi:peptide deformylase